MLRKTSAGCGWYLKRSDADYMETTHAQSAISDQGIFGSRAYLGAGHIGENEYE